MFWFLTPSNSQKLTALGCGRCIRWCLAGSSFTHVTPTMHIYFASTSYKDANVKHRIMHIIADVGVTKRHQQLDKIRIIFTRTQKKKNSVMQYTPSTLNAIQSAQHTLARLL